MALMQDLLTIDTRLALGGAQEYREALADDAIVIVPGAVLDKPGCVAAMEASPGWESVELEDAHLIQSGTTASVVYRFHGVRGDTEYRAVLSSTYRVADRALLLHQHTPDAG
jgi:hypothetical protein